MKKTISILQAKKGLEKITSITAYDALFAEIFDEMIDVILIGDSLNMSFGGQKDTLSINIDDMIYHTKAVCRGAKKSFIISDLPFGSYGYPKIALKNATRIYQETCADAIKLEGGSEKTKLVKHLVSEGIAVVAHIGLMPQFARSEGGYKIKGKDKYEAEELLESALAMEESGACMIVLEGIRAEAAQHITNTLKIPTIGIGSGLGCDGQILVWSDAFGFFQRFKPKFVRQYLQGADLVRNALQNYINDVKTGKFPSTQESY